MTLFDKRVSSAAQGESGPGGAPADRIDAPSTEWPLASTSGNRIGRCLPFLGMYDESIPERVERITGADLGGARIHTDAEAGRRAQAVNARAVTIGKDVYFADGQVDDETLAEELTHVAQLGCAEATSAPGGVSARDDPAETQARHVAWLAMSGARARVAPVAADPSVAHRRPATRVTGDLRDPREFPTYESFLAGFAELETFRSAEGLKVIGDGPAGADERPPMRGRRAGAEYVEAPTRAYLERHLPAELAHTVYQLPADCADVALLLRHVWCFAHGRTERFGGWVIGAGAGETTAERQRNLGDLIVNHVSTENLKGMVGSAYDDCGRSYEALKRVLHPGDILVWAERDLETGRELYGHSQTISDIQRNGDAIEAIHTVQGNMPIGEVRAEAIREDQRENHQPVSDAWSLRTLPGRRIEKASIEGGDLGDEGGVWTRHGGGATLVKAGPPSGVTRPRRARGSGKARDKSLSDWFPALRKAKADQVVPIFEAALAEARARLEGAPFGDAEVERIHADLERHAAELGRLTGARLQQLRRSGASTESLVSIAREMGESAQGAHQDLIEDLFEVVAGGIASIRALR